MLLCDKDIRELCLPAHEKIVGRQHIPQMLDPFSEGVKEGGVISFGLTHAGYDLRLGWEFWAYKNTYGEVVDPKGFRDEEYVKRVLDKMTIEQGQYFYLGSHGYVLGRSLEYIRIPRHIKARCVGKSTLARVGILINTTPLEPGWEGYLTIEIGNTSPSTVRLYPGEGISQLEFETLSSEPETSYADKRGVYMHQTGVTAARVS